jgi:hypothetical protein
MARTTLNLAAIPVKFVAVPLIAGLLAGTGAVAAYVGGPTSAPRNTAQIVAALPATAAPVTSEPVVSDQAAPSKPNKKKSCEEQTWPYIENRCIVRSEPAQQVRLVMAPRKGDAGLSSTAAPNLITSDGVLRGPGVAPEADHPAAGQAKPIKKAAKRSELRRQGRNEFRRDYSVYSVPSADSTKPVIVVRPLRLNAYSSRF